MREIENFNKEKRLKNEKWGMHEIKVHSPLRYFSNTEIRDLYWLQRQLNQIDGSYNPIRCHTRQQS